MLLQSIQSHFYFKLSQCTAIGSQLSTTLRVGVTVCVSTQVVEIRIKMAVLVEWFGVSNQNPLFQNLR